MPLHKPTLADLRRRIAEAHKSGQRPLNEEPCQRILCCQHLQPNSSFYAALNKAHHRPRDIAPADAKALNDHLNAVEGMINACVAAYARFMSVFPMIGMLRFPRVRPHRYRASP